MDGVMKLAAIALALLLTGCAGYTIVPAECDRPAAELSVADRAYCGWAVGGAPRPGERKR